MDVPKRCPLRDKDSSQDCLVLSDGKVAAVALSFIGREGRSCTAFFSLPRSPLFGLDFCLMVNPVAWKAIEAWFSEVKEYRMNQNGKINHL